MSSCSWLRELGLLYVFSNEPLAGAIPPEHLSHIFDRFYRVDKWRSRQNGGGSGIGLIIARSLVDAHGGQIWAESAGEGKRSTIVITLPAEK